MIKLLDFIFGKHKSFYPFEIDILNLLMQKLNFDAANRVRNQIEAVNKIVRLSNGKEVNLYRMKFGKAEFDESLRFPNSAPESLLATATITNPVSKALLKIEIWLANGRLFSIVFNKAPLMFFEGRSLDSVRVENTDMDVNINLLAIANNYPKDYSDRVEVIHWLESWFNLQSFSEVFDPLPVELRDQIIISLDAVLPTDYLTCIEHSDGFRIGDCHVLGLNAIRKVSLEADNFYVLAEVDSYKAIGVMEGDRNGKLYLFDFNRDVIEQLSSNFKDTVYRNS